MFSFIQNLSMLWDKSVSSGLGFKSENIISDSNGTRTHKHIARNIQSFLDIKSLKTSDIASFSSKFFDIETTIECRFTLKHVRDMIITYSLKILLSHILTTPLKSCG